MACFLNSFFFFRKNTYIFSIFSVLLVNFFDLAEERYRLRYIKQRASGDGFQN